MSIDLATSEKKTPLSLTRIVRPNYGALFSGGLLFLLQALIMMSLPIGLFAIVDLLLGNLDLASVSAIFATQWPTLSDLGANSTDFNPLAVGLIAGLGLSLLLACTLIEGSGERLFTKLSSRISISLQNQFLKSLLNTQKSTLESYPGQRIHSTLLQEADFLAGAYTTACKLGFSTLPKIIIALSVLTVVNMQFALLVGSSLLLAYAILVTYSMRIERAHFAIQKSNDDLTRDLHQALMSLDSIKSMALEPEVLKNAEQKTLKASLNKKRLSNLHNSIAAASQLIRYFVYALMLWHFSSQWNAGGSLTVGLILLPIAYFELLREPLARLVEFSFLVPRVRQCLNQFAQDLHFLIEHEELEGSQNTSSLPFPDAHNLRFEGVSFGFESSRPLLNKFSAEFHPGELVAVVGPSGLGKSTLGKLLIRILDPSEGRIFIGRTEIRRFRLQLLRKTITLVSQNPYFINGTIRENLLLTTEGSDVSEQKITEALRSAGASDFVNTLSDRLDTVIGENGRTLTPSEAKRLNLARAFLRDQSRIFIFDEPTRGLDEESTETLFEAIRKLADSGALVFWISHNLEEVPIADQIIFFRPGSSPLVGQHEQLLEISEGYRRHFANSIVQN